VTDPAVEAVQRAWTDFHGGPAYYSSMTGAMLEAASEALKPIRELHRKDGDYCWSCDHTSWPCATAKLIYTAEELS
jgi:hypothetical protein